MRGLARFFFLVSAMCLLPFGCDGDNTNTTGSGGKAGEPCEREEDCDDGDVCTFDFCIDNKCKYNNATNGPQPGAEQIDGDCMVVACQDGVGETIVDDNDPPDDPVGNDCTEPACMLGTSMTVNTPVGDGCDAGGMQGSCDGMGVCSCAVPTGDPNASAWVDPLEGNDVPGQGARPGGCAFKTLTFALTQYQGTIRLFGGGTYDTASGESFPLTLGATQYVRCTDFNGDRATLSGSGSYAGGTATVVFSGTENGLRECNLVGQGASDVVAITSNGTGGVHEIRDTDVTGGGNGITVTDTGDRFDVFNNNIHNNGGIGFNVLGGDKIGDLDNNNFSANTGGDVSCVSMSPDFNGGGNGGPSCAGCQNCPF